MTRNFCIAIQVYDWEDRAPIWRSTVWLCPLEYIYPVDSVVWEFLPAIESPLDRVALVTNNAMCTFLKCLTLGTVTYVLYNKNVMQCVVKYIGPIKLMGTGFYIGIQLLVNIKKNCVFVYEKI